MSTEIALEVFKCFCVRRAGASIDGIGVLSNKELELYHSAIDVLLNKKVKK